MNSILGAIGRPYHRYHPSLSAKAAALLHGVATSHGFNDANKRTAWLISDVLIFNSGYDMIIGCDDKIDDLVVDVVTGEMSQLQLMHWFDARLIEFTD